MFLTPEERKTLTGYTRYTAQAKWLRERGWMFELSASGEPIVAKAYAESKLGARQSAWKPDFRDLR